MFCAGHQTENNRAKIYKDDIPFPSLSFRRLDCLEVRLERYSATFQSTEGSARYHHSARLIALDKKQALHTHHYHMRGVTRAFLCRDLLLLRNTSSLALLPLPPGHLFSFFLPVEVTGRWGRRGRGSSHLVPILSYLLLRSSSRSLSLWRHRQGCLFVWLCFFFSFSFVRKIMALFPGNQRSPKTTSGCSRDHKTRITTTLKQRTRASNDTGASALTETLWWRRPTDLLQALSIY